MKKSIELHKIIDNTINKGDKVLFMDGSSLTILDKTREDNEYYIVYDYPEETGSDNILKEIIGTVIEINIQDKVCNSDLGWCYLQDCIVQLGNAQFRTASAMIRRI